MDYSNGISLYTVNGLSVTANIAVVKSDAESGSGNSSTGGKTKLNGTANAGGDWQVEDTETSLTGELGREIVVRNGKWFTVGDDGAEFVNIQRGDIVFNHKQTEDLLKHGFVAGRGKAYADGTAYVGGSGYWWHSPIFNPGNGYGGNGGSNSGSGGSSGGKDDVEEYISTLWQLYEVEKRLKDVQDNKEHLESQLDTIDNLVEQIKLRKQLIETYKQEQDAQHALNEARRVLIKDKIPELEKQGFKIKYDAESNDIFIENTKHINDLIGATTEETNDLRKEAEEAINTINEWNDANIEGSEAWHEPKYAMQEAKAEIVNTSLQVHDNFIEYADTFDLWGKTGVSRVQALSTKLNDLNRLYREGYLSAEQYRELWLDTAGDLYDEQKDSLEEIISLTEKMIKQEIDTQIKGLEKLKEEYAEIIRLKKEALETNKDEEDHQKELDEKLSEMAKKKARIDKLALAENSGDKNAAAEKTALEEEYAKLQKELIDFQSDYAYDKQMEALDKEQEAFEDQKDKEIKKLQESIDTEAKLYQAAIDRINSGWNTLYDDLMAWNSEYGDGIAGEDSIASAWNSAKDVMNSYYDELTQRANALGALNGIKTDTSPGNTGGFTDNTEHTAQVSAKAAKMKANSNEWLTTKDKERRDQLSKENARLASEIEGISKRKLVRGSDGEWYFDRVGGDKLYDIYHDGGEVGNTLSKKDNEVFALLEKGELVINKESTGKLYQALDFASALADKVSGLPKITPNLPQIPSLLNGLNASTPDFNFDVTVHCDGAMAEEDAVRAGQKIADTALEKLSDVFNHTGKYSQVSDAFFS